MLNNELNKYKEYELIEYFNNILRNLKKDTVNKLQQLIKNRDLYIHCINDLKNYDIRNLLELYDYLDCICYETEDSEILEKIFYLIKSYKDINLNGKYRLPGMLVKINKIFKKQEALDLLEEIYVNMNIMDAKNLLELYNENDLDDTNIRKIILEFINNETEDFMEYDACSYIEVWQMLGNDIEDLIAIAKERDKLDNLRREANILESLI